MKRRIALSAALLLGAALSGPALADHRDTASVAIGGGIGGALGAVIGNELGGRDGAVIGGAVGGATGVAISSDGRGSRRHHDDRFIHDRRHHDDRHFRGHGRGHGRGFCPPGLAMQGRC